MPDRRKIYSEQEATELVLAAAQLQEAAPAEAGDYVPGLTFEELARMAKELGVKEEYLAQAMAARERDEKTKTEHKQKGDFLGIPWVREYEAVLDGELPPEHFDVVVEELNATGGSQGASTTQVGRMVQGSVSSGLGYGRFKLVSRKGRTRMSMRSSSLLPFVYFGQFMVLVGMFAGGFLADKGFVPWWAGMGIFLGATALGIAVSGWLGKFGHRRMKERFERIVEKVAVETEGVQENWESSGEEVPGELRNRLGQ